MQFAVGSVIQNMSFTGLLVTVVFLLVSWYYRKYRNIPPGPHGIPLIGYGPFLRPDPPQKLLDLKQYYGKVMSIFFGSQLTIILNDYEAIKDAFVNQGYKFTGRPSTFMFDLISEKYRDGHDHGWETIEGEDWKQTRRFTVQSLRELGMGKHAMQNRILEEAEHLCSVFRQNIGKPFNAKEIFHASAMNTISTMCFGRRFDYHDPNFRHIRGLQQTFAVLIEQSGPVQAYPLLRFLPGPFARAWASWVATSESIVKWTLREMDKVAKVRKEHPGSVVPNMLDSYWTEQERLKALGNQPERSRIFQDVDIRINVQGMFGAGTETTATTMNWAVLFMLHFPDIQAKVHKEIDERVGVERSITLDDKAKLPYLEAVIREAQRRGNVIPFGLIRCNTEETDLLGYRIPERSNVMVNYKAVNMDPVLWGDPEEYRPERFLNAKGQLEEPPYFMPFSVGKRNCIGEALARMELFLFFSNLMQRFELKPFAGLELPSFDKCITGISCRPIPFQMDIIART